MNRDELTLEISKLIISNHVEPSTAVAGALQASVFMALDAGLSKEVFLASAESLWVIGEKAMARLSKEDIFEA